METYETFPHLTADELEQQLEGMWNFISKTHAFLEQDEKRKIRQLGEDIAIEIRALRRDKEEGKLYQRLFLYRITEGDKKRLREFLVKLNKPQKRTGKVVPYCLYYTVYSFNKKIHPNNRDGYVKGWVIGAAQNNTLFTQCLVMDFDNMGYERFNHYYQKLLDLGIETISLFTGHGYQSVILLSTPSRDLNLLQKFTRLLMNNGFPVDAQIQPSTQIMRMPYSFNAKGMMIGEHQLEPIIYGTKILHDTTKRYEVSDIFNRIEQGEVTSLDFQIKSDEIGVNDQIEEMTPELVEWLKQTYPMFAVPELPLPVQRMLLGFKPHKYNHTIYFLTLFFKYLGYSYSTICEAMAILGRQNRYAYAYDKELILNDVKRFFYSEYKINNIFHEELSSSFGSFDTIHYALTTRDIVKIPNEIFRQLSKMDAMTFRIYLALKLHQFHKQENEFDKAMLVKLLNTCEKTVRKHIKILINEGYLIKKRRLNRKQGDADYYILNTHESEYFGFTQIRSAVLDSLLIRTKYKEMSPRELMVAIYFKYKTFGQKEHCIISQKTIAMDMGVSRSAINKAVGELKDSGLIALTEHEFMDITFVHQYVIKY